MNEMSGDLSSRSDQGLTLVAKKKYTLRASGASLYDVGRASQRKNPTEGGDGKRKKEYEQRSTRDVHSEGHVEIRLGL
jgi:hypothetical protein